MHTIQIISIAGRERKILKNCRCTTCAQKMHKQIIIALIVLRLDGYHGFNRSLHNPRKLPSSSSPLRVASTTAWATSNDGLGELWYHSILNLLLVWLSFRFSVC